MDDEAAVAVLEAADDLVEEGEGLRGRECTAADEELEKLQAVDKLHDEEEVRLNLKDVDKRHDVRVGEEFED